MKRWMTLIVALLMVFSLACGGAKPTQEPATQEPAGQDEVAESPKTQEPADDEEDTGSESGDDAAAAFSAQPNATNELDSYRGRMTWTFMPTGEAEQNIYMEYEATSDPVAKRLLMSGSGLSEELMGDSGMEGDSFEFEAILTEETQWIRFGEEWMQAPATDDMMEGYEDMLIDANDLTEGVDDKDYKFIGKEKVNGINTRHYRAEYKSIMGMLGLGEGEIKKGVADVWVADESGLPEVVVRIVMEVEGTIDGDEGSFTVEQELYDINASFTIEVPEGAASGGMPEDIPMYPNAEEFTGMGGMYFFTSVDDVETVAQFYEDGLAEAGWSKIDDTTITGLVMTTWEKDGQTLSLTVTTGEDDVGTSVIITIE